MGQHNTLNHLAIVVDGNRRWARQHNLPPYMDINTGLSAWKKQSIMQ